MSVDDQTTQQEAEVHIEFAEDASGPEVINQPEVVISVERLLATADIPGKQNIYDLLALEIEQGLMGVEPNIVELDLLPEENKYINKKRDQLQIEALQFGSQMQIVQEAITNELEAHRSDDTQTEVTCNIQDDYIEVVGNGKGMTIATFLSNILAPHSGEEGKVRGKFGQATVAYPLLSDDIEFVSMPENLDEVGFTAKLQTDRKTGKRTIRIKALAPNPERAPGTKVRFNQPKLEESDKRILPAVLTANLENVDYGKVLIQVGDNEPVDANEKIREAPAIERGDVKVKLIDTIANNSTSGRPVKVNIAGETLWRSDITGENVGIENYIVIDLPKSTMTAEARSVDYITLTKQHIEQVLGVIEAVALDVNMTILQRAHVLADLSRAAAFLQTKSSEQDIYSDLGRKVAAKLLTLIEGDDELKILPAYEGFDKLEIDGEVLVVDPSILVYMPEDLRRNAIVTCPNHPEMLVYRLNDHDEPFLKYGDMWVVDAKYFEVGHEEAVVVALNTALKLREDIGVEQDNLSRFVIAEKNRQHAHVIPPQEDIFPNHIVRGQREEAANPLEIIRSHTHQPQESSRQTEGENYELHVLDIEVKMGDIATSAIKRVKDSRDGLISYLSQYHETTEMQILTDLVAANSDEIDTVQSLIAGSTPQELIEIFTSTVSGKQLLEQLFFYDDEIVPPACAKVLSYSNNWNPYELTQFLLWINYPNNSGILNDLIYLDDITRQVARHFFYERYHDIPPNKQTAFKRNFLIHEIVSERGWLESLPITNNSLLAGFIAQGLMQTPGVTEKSVAETLPEFISNLYRNLYYGNPQNIVQFADYLNSIGPILPQLLQYVHIQTLQRQKEMQHENNLRAARVSEKRGKPWEAKTVEYSDAMSYVMYSFVKNLLEVSRTIDPENLNTAFNRLESQSLSHLFFEELFTPAIDRYYTKYNIIHTVSLANEYQAMRIGELYKLTEYAAHEYRPGNNFQDSNSILFNLFNSFIQENGEGNLQWDAFNLFKLLAPIALLEENVYKEELKSAISILEENDSRATEVWILTHLIDKPQALVHEHVRQARKDAYATPGALDFIANRGVFKILATQLDPSITLKAYELARHICLAFPTEAGQFRDYNIELHSNRFYNSSFEDKGGSLYLSSPDNNDTDQLSLSFNPIEYIRRPISIHSIPDWFENNEAYTEHDLVDIQAAITKILGEGGSLVELTVDKFESVVEEVAKTTFNRASYQRRLSSVITSQGERQDEFRHIPEWIQNSQNAEANKVISQTGIDSQGRAFFTVVDDGKGMSPIEVIANLGGTPGMKVVGDVSEGSLETFHQGWATALNKAQEIRVVSSKGDGEVTYRQYIPVFVVRDGERFVERVIVRNNVVADTSATKSFSQMTWYGTPSLESAIEVQRMNEQLRKTNKYRLDEELEVFTLSSRTVISEMAVEEIQRILENASIQDLDCEKLNMLQDVVYTDGAWEIRLFKNGFYQEDSNNIMIQGGFGIGEEMPQEVLDIFPDLFVESLKAHSLSFGVGIPRDVRLNKSRSEISNVARFAHENKSRLESMAIRSFARMIATGKISSSILAYDLTGDALNSYGFLTEYEIDSLVALEEEKYVAVDNKPDDDTFVKLSMNLPLVELEGTNQKYSLLDIIVIHSGARYLVNSNNAELSEIVSDMIHRSEDGTLVLSDKAVVMMERNSRLFYQLSQRGNWIFSNVRKRLQQQMNLLSARTRDILNPVVTGSATGVFAQQMLKVNPTPETLGIGAVAGVGLLISTMFNVAINAKWRSKNSSKGKSQIQDKPQSTADVDGGITRAALTQKQIQRIGQQYKDVAYKAAHEAVRRNDEERAARTKQDKFLQDSSLAETEPVDIPYVFVALFTERMVNIMFPEKDFAFTNVGFYYEDTDSGTRADQDSEAHAYGTTIGFNLKGRSFGSLAPNLLEAINTGDFQYFLAVVGAGIGEIVAHEAEHCVESGWDPNTAPEGITHDVRFRTNVYRHFSRFINEAFTQEIVEDSPVLKLEIIFNDIREKMGLDDNVRVEYMRGQIEFYNGL